MAGREGGHTAALPDRWLSTLATASSQEFRVVRADGAYLWDDDGTRYLDLVTNGGVNILGHAHPRFTAALAAQVEALPALQAVLIYVLDEYDRWRDDTLKWAEMPYPQAGPGLRQTRRRLEALGPSLRALPLIQVVPPLEQVAAARARLERKLAGLRCVEAVRLYAAAHDGKLPAALDAFKEVPVPADPVTGRPFGYALREGRAVLVAPPPAGETAVAPDHAWRYELTVKR